jgi:hypothetical protein
MPNDHSPVKGRNGIEKFFQKDMADGVASAQASIGRGGGGGGYRRCNTCRRIDEHLWMDLQTWAGGRG